MERQGWFGLTDHLMHFLRTVGADRGPDGLFLIGGAPITTGLGGQEVVVPAETVYFLDGHAAGLAAGLRGTSYGMAITVI